MYLPTADSSCMDAAERPDDRDPEPPPRPLTPGQFSIGALLLLTLWISVCLAIFRLSPVIGAALGIWTVPGAIRALIVIQVWKPRVQTLSWGDLYEIGGHSLILVAAAEVAAFFAFGLAAIACLLLAAAAGLAPQVVMVPAIACGLVVGTAAACLVFWFGRPSQFDKPA